LDKISAKHGNHKFQITRAPFGCHGADRSSIEYQHIFNDENGRNERLERFFIEEHNPAMGGYHGYPATYSINRADVSRDEYRQTNANMKDLMDPENFIGVINNGIENSNKQNRELLFYMDKAIQKSMGKSLPRGMMKEVFKYAKPDAVENGENINNAFVEAIQRKLEQRGNACNKCAIF
jgi:hypothetical protein